MTDKPNYYAIIPASIRYDKKLSSSEKLFYAEITALSNQYGHCWASNKYFSKLYAVSTSTISSWVSKLKKENHINVEYKKEGKQIKKRIITPIQKTGRGYSENLKGGSQKTGRGYSENLKENTTSNNNTSKEYTREFENFWNLYDLKKGKHEAFIKWRNLSRDEQEQAIAGIETFKTHFSSDQYTPRPRKYLNNRYWEDEGYSEQADNENSNINKFF